MVRVCAFPSCETKMKRYNPETFHRLPLRSARSLVIQWLIALNMDIKTPLETLTQKDYRVCSAHFHEDDFNVPKTADPANIKRARLKRHAVPRVQPLATDRLKIEPCEESCPGITFDVSEFTFDEESSCSNEEEEEKKKIGNSDSDWELELSDQLESDDSDSDFDFDSQKTVRQLCPECGAFFFTCKTHTCEYKIKPVSCNICGKRCVDKSALKAHSNIHKESYEHLCKFCMAPFKTRLDKRDHERAHTHKAKPYECPDCSMTFSKLPVRNLHLKGHRGPKRYTCPHCGLEFRDPNHLERHIMVHTGVKEFVCEFCSRSFNQQGHLKSHLRVHTGEKPFQCQHCDESFNHNVSLKSHVMRYHKGGASDSGLSGPVKRTKRVTFQSMCRPRGRPKRKSATGEPNSIPAVQGEAPDPTTAAEMSGKGCLGRNSSEDIDGDWSDRDPSSELREEDKTEEVRKIKRKASQKSKTFSIAEKVSESDSDSNPEEEVAKKRKVVKSQETGRTLGSI